MGKSKKPKIKKKEMPACPPEIIKQFTDHGFEADWVQGEYEIFTTNYPSGKAKKAELITRLTTAATERLPNCDAANVANTLYPAFDPEDQGGKINKKEFMKFVAFVNETAQLGLAEAEMKGLTDEVFAELGKDELTIEDVTAVVAARWGA